MIVFFLAYVDRDTNCVILSDKPLRSGVSFSRVFHARVPDGFQLDVLAGQGFLLKNGEPCLVSVDSLGRPLVFDPDLGSFVQIPLISEGFHEGWRVIDFDAISELNRPV